MFFTLSKNEKFFGEPKLVLLCHCCKNTYLNPWCWRVHEKSFHHFTLKHHRTEDINNKVTLSIYELSVFDQTLIFLEDVCPASECRIHYHQRYCSPRPSIRRTTQMKPSVFAICTLFVNYSWANTVSFFLSLAHSLTQIPHIFLLHFSSLLSS